MKSPPKGNPNAGEQKLTTAETADLANHERTIKSNKGAFVASGRALETIRDRKLYRVQYPTFEKYCEEKWGWKKSQAYRLIEAAQTVATSPSGDKIETECQARVLSGIAPERHEEVFERAISGGRPTAHRISEEAEKGPIIDVDETGYPIPEKAMSYWTRADEMKAILKLISEARCAVRDLNQEDRMYGEVHLQGVAAILNDASRQFAQAVPYAVCTSCQGQVPDSCCLCKGRGVISKFRYDTVVPIEAKEIRSKATKKSTRAEQLGRSR